ncbi:hypothetical protein [Actinomadura alba]|uniref:PQQ-binding-like beta-propeller repeat protein n=1 Tax=Actinomadura alba TaxID=406431 RepID=A0ABR7LQF4_9ACTN|nr:hypothetical protein [Actinomadura alba]MBC6466814.1 hypothetical protein [Actinomadura alba]
MPLSLVVDRIFGDRPFAEISDPALAVADEHGGLLAVAGASGFGRRVPVGVYGTGDLTCRALFRSRYPVHAMAFHPTLPLLAVGTGMYDGGYFFRGELLILHLEAGKTISLIEGHFGRQVLGLEWLAPQALRVLMAPPDDWQDEKAHVDGHVAVVRRPDWNAVPARSLTGHDLAGPRVSAPRRDGREAAREAVTQLSADWEPRRDVRAVERLSDGRILAALGGTQLESWLPSGEREWAVPDEEGGREIVVAADETTAWVALERPEWQERPQSVVQLSLSNGTQLDHVVPSAPASLVRCADDRPALAPCRHGDRSRGAFPVRRGSHLYFIKPEDEERGAARARVVAVALPTLAARQPSEPLEAEIRSLFPYSWAPGETHFGGPGVETTDETLVHAGTVYDGHGLQPGGSFVVRRPLTNGTPHWVFRTDRPATALDADANTAYVAYVTYDDGEIVALKLHDGTVRWRQNLTVGAVSAVPTALTIGGPGSLLIGTSDGRILDCSTV